MHQLVRQLEKDKAKVMAEQFAAERKSMQSAENKRRNPLRGTTYPKDYKSVIIAPIPEPDPETIWETKAREEIRKVSYEVKVTAGSAMARYE